MAQVPPSHSHKAGDWFHLHDPQTLMHVPALCLALPPFLDGGSCAWEFQSVGERLSDGKGCPLDCRRLTKKAVLSPSTPSSGRVALLQHSGQEKDLLGLAFWAMSRTHFLQ